MAGRQYVRVSPESGRVTFLPPDPARELAGVRLMQDALDPYLMTQLVRQVAQ